MFIFISGLMLGILLAVNDEIALGLGLGFFFSVLSVIGYLCQHKYYKPVVKILFGLLLGSILAYQHVIEYNRWHVPTHLIGTNVSVVGKIAEISLQNQLQSQFILQTELVNQQRQRVRLRLSWYDRHHPHLLLGTTWQLVVRLKPPHGLQNPGGFNYKQWLWQQNIQATGYIVNHPQSRKAKTANLQMSNYWQQNKILNSQQDSLLARWRQHIQEVIIQAVVDPELAALLSALTVGLRDGFTSQIWRVLQQTGTNHLVVIAGLHLGLLTTVVFFSLRYLCCFFPQLLLHWPAKHIAAIGALGIVWWYALLAGYSVPTQRAVWMLTLLIIGQLYYRTTLAWRRLLFAAGIVILLAPMAIFTASFWLSFGACALILYGMLGWNYQKAHWRQWLRVQWVVFVGLIPLTVYFFQQVAFTMLLANALAIPWIGFIVVPLGCLASVLTLCHATWGHELFYVIALLLSPMWHILQFLAKFPQLQWHHAILQPWILATSIMGILLLLAPRGIPGRWLGILWLLPLYYYRLPEPPGGALWITMLDVGQGLAVVVQTKHHALVYDTGPKLNEDFDAGADIIIPYLRRLHLSRLDLLMISHGDNDHSGGAAAILQTMPVKQIVTSIPNLFPKQHAIACHAGQHWQWDGWTLRVLSPPLHQAYQDNNSSCVLRISHDQQRVLFTGDIEVPVEKELLVHNPQALSAEVLIVPHHGSITSSSTAFITAVHPRYALFSFGYYNRYHLPSTQVVARYLALGAHILSTAFSGAITLQLTPTQPIKVQTVNKNGYNEAHV